MNYQRIYDEIIARAKTRDIDGYTENHHILPKCMDGTDNPDNLVKLTGREHFLAHWLLYKIHGTPTLAYAWNAMCINSHSNSERYTSKSFEYARIASGKAQSLRISGTGHHLYGTHHTEETKAKISRANKGKSKHSPEAKAIRRQWVIDGVTGMTGKNHSEESKLKISRARKGKYGIPVIRISLDGDTKYYSTSGITSDDGFDPSAITKCCKGIYKTHKGYSWKYADQV